MPNTNIEPTIDRVIDYLLEPCKAIVNGNMVGHLGISAHQGREELSSIASWKSDDGQRYTVVHSAEAMVLFIDGEFSGVAHYNAEQLQARDVSGFGRVENAITLASGIL